MRTVATCHVARTQPPCTDTASHAPPLRSRAMESLPTPNPSPSHAGDHQDHGELLTLTLTLTLTPLLTLTLSGRRSSGPWRVSTPTCRRGAAPNPNPYPYPNPDLLSG